MLSVGRKAFVDEIVERSVRGLNPAGGLIDLGHGQVVYLYSKH